MRIQTKLFVVYLLAAILLMGALTYFLTERSASLLFEAITETKEQTLAQITSNLDNELRSYEETANSFYLNITLQQMLTERYADKRLAYREYFGFLQPYLSLLQGTKDIYRVNFYSDNPTLPFANVILLDDEIRGEAWYKALMAKPSGMYWTNSYPVPMFDERVFSLRQKLDYLEPGTELYASIEVRERELRQLVAEESRDARILFVLKDGHVLLDSADPEKKRAKLEQYSFAAEIGEGDGHFQLEEDGSSSLVLYRHLNSRSALRDMQVILLVPLDELMPKVERMRWLAYVMLSVSCVLAALLVYGLSIGLTKRLTTLAKKMRNVHQDRYRGYVEVKGNDEISQLGRIFNEMVKQLERLIREVYQAEIDSKELALRTREAEFYALQAQINPHYLFNVLNMLRANLLDLQDGKNADIVDMIARTFRFLLHNKSERITVREELELVGTYLKIQKLRYEHRLQFRIEVPEDALDLLIPKLTLQPLVENALAHGLEPNAEPTLIQVCGVKKGDGWLISVEDNGIGIGEERLTEIGEWLSGKQSVLSENHIGIRNVHYRLTAIFGAESGLRISSEGRGARAAFYVPANAAELRRDEGSEGAMQDAGRAHRG
ncbi:cache domain-containing sensor histidine kinase [Cohnella herbarum]|uniref:Sensor histidine kinase n=1 Tax=Cohnella herbarum TaxID=2728023 RepID=A0A7Z2ZP66_9BACL|nr:sensor histidine kinase [Cohnella herbarum]QJD86570.1 sensor histidine kinase [Cohnella herbarum]